MTTANTKQTFLVPFDEMATTWTRYYAEVEASSAEEALNLVSQATEETAVLRNYALADYQGEVLEVVEVEKQMCDDYTAEDVKVSRNEAMSDEIAKAIALLQSCGYAVISTSDDNKTLANLTGSEKEVLESCLEDGKRTCYAREHIEEVYVDEVKNSSEASVLLGKILKSFPQEVGKPEGIML